jgi:hypothetical protein
MRNHSKFGIALLATAGTLVVTGATPANAAACPQPGSFALGTLTPLDFSCDQGGFTFKLTSWSGFIASDSISFSNPTPDTFNYSIQANTPWTGGSKILNYMVTAPLNKLLNGHTAALNTAVFAPTNATFTVAGVNSTSGVMNNNVVNPGLIMYGTPLATDTFTATLDSISGGGVQVVNSTYSAVMAPMTAVPGPLPILGVGAAFGFSRKLRRRIKLAA